MILIRVGLEVTRAGTLDLDPLGLFTSSQAAIDSVKLAYSRLPEVSFKEYPDKVEVQLNYTTGSLQGFLRPVDHPKLRIPYFAAVFGAGVRRPYTSLRRNDYE